MTARIEHHKVVALTALAAMLCVLLLATLFVAVRPVETILPGGNVKVTSAYDRDATEDAPSIIDRIDRHAEVVARYQEGSPR